MSFKQLICLIFIFCICPALAQEGPGEVTDNWVELSKPGDAHRKLDALVGDWKVKTSIWMDGPEQPPTVFPGQATSKWILDGRFVEETTESIMTFPGEDGGNVEVPFSGRGMTGYDNFRKMYVSTWVDSTTTYIAFYKGQLSKDGKVLTMYGEMDEPAQGVVGRLLRIQTVMETKDKHVFTMYDLHAGEDYKVIEIVYERI